MLGHVESAGLSAKSIHMSSKFMTNGFGLAGFCKSDHFHVVTLFVQILVFEIYTFVIIYQHIILMIHSNVIRD